MRVWITGAFGAAGKYFEEYLWAEHKGSDIFGGNRWVCDLTDMDQVCRYTDTVKPDRIFHFASKADIANSFKGPLPFFKDNVLGTANLLEAARLLLPTTARILMVSSCEVYGPPQSSPMTEDHPFNPMSPYAVSKACQDQMARMYAKVYGMHIVTSRLFNYVNPRRADLFTTSFARQIAEIEVGKRTELVHGNLDSARSLLDVRDVVRGYWDLLEHGEPGEAYNIGADKEVSIEYVLNYLASKAKCPINTRQDESLLRPVDIKTQIADQSKFLKCTNWQPRYTLNESLDWLLGEARKNVS